MTSSNMSSNSTNQRSNEHISMPTPNMNHQPLQQQGVFLSQQQQTLSFPNTTLTTTFTKQ